MPPLHFTVYCVMKSILFCNCVLVYCALCICVFGPLSNCVFCIVMYLQCMPPLDLSSWAAADNGIRRYCASPPSLLCLSASLHCLLYNLSAKKWRRGMQCCCRGRSAEKMAPPSPSLLLLLYLEASSASHWLESPDPRAIFSTLDSRFIHRGAVSINYFVTH